MVKDEVTAVVKQKNHPDTKKMVLTAMEKIDEKNSGVSFASIKKYVFANYNVGESYLQYLKKFINKALVTEMLTHKKGKGLNGSLKINKKMKEKNKTTKLASKIAEKKSEITKKSDKKDDGTKSKKTTKKSKKVDDKKVVAKTKKVIKKYTTEISKKAKSQVKAPAKKSTTASKSKKTEDAKKSKTATKKKPSSSTKTVAEKKDKVEKSKPVKKIITQISISKMIKQYDIIIFGATGYTGRFAIKEGIKILKDVKWAVAGRNTKKLQDSLAYVGRKMNVDLSEIPIIIADVSDERSIKEMTAQAKVIVNCCGPYHLFGEVVVKSCIETGTSVVDISGESQFIEGMQLKYNDAAREKGVYIISACGLESIPSEIGINFMQQKFKGTLHYVEGYLSMFAERGFKPKGPALNFGTFHSAVYALSNFFEMNRIRAKLYSTPMPQMKPKLKNRFVHKREIDGKTRWALPLIEPDPAVVRRSQRYLYEHENQRPIQMESYIVFSKFYQVFAILIFAAFLAILSQFSFGRKLLLNYPDFFSFGILSRNEPDEETMEKTMFEMTLFGSGWEEEFSDLTDNINAKMNKKMTVKVSGRNPGYGSTSIALLLSAMTILNESGKIPDNGGVLAPGAAFRKTNIINELQANGIKFEVVENDK
ncbi:hypothetical protein PVAND_001010 [Polypedilum vanderplanki]|uniref:H15 domain-containing protein n=1 Tax=Polypedilum vanderplanki TaxID=319348 RepID=A0A9J6BLM1_POLVA|nr:hypothetical protein PVAND_001010 [Polypedilum vanderplanki]